MVRVRIAPSPTGFPHLGLIYQALFDYAFAKKNNGKFFIRIEDTDRARFVEGAEDKIYAGLDWVGLTEDESPRKGGEFGPYRQSERQAMGIYKKYALELIEKGGAYYCFCTKERLEQLRKSQETNHQPTMYDKHCRNLSKEEIEKKLSLGESYIIRLKVPENKTIEVEDLIRGKISFDSNLIEDAVLLKADGFPTYHLASSVVDDHLMQTTHVVRGEEWLPSLPKHWLMYEYFGWEKPIFIHTPTIRNPDKSKFSKRYGHTGVDWYINEGFLPEAIRNYLALLSWSHPEGKEIFSLEEFIEVFDFKDIKPVGPVFDLEKLKWMNGEYIRNTKVEILSDKLKEFFKDDDEIKSFFKENASKMDQIILLAQSRMKTLKEFKDLVVYNPTELSLQEKDFAKKLKSEFENIKIWNKDNILNAMREILKTTGAKGNLLYKVLTGKDKGLPLPDMLEILGKEETLKNLH